MSGHNNWTNANTNYKEKPMQHGYLWVSKDGEETVFMDYKSDSEEIVCEEVTVYYTDRFMGFFFTRKGAEDYLQYQSHNLSDEAYIYTFTPGYRNQQMEKLLSDDF